MTGGPWGQTMGGQIVGGLLGWALDRHGDDDLQPARLTVDLLRPVPIAPVSIETSIQREGRRIKLVDAAMLQNGRVVARASALFLRRSAEPEGQVWSAPVAMPPMPANSEPLEAEMPFGIWTASATSDPGTAGMPPLGVGAAWCAEVRVDAHVSPDGGRAPTHAVHPCGLCRRHHQFVDALEHSRLAVHQCRLHGGDQPIARRRVHRAGCGELLRERWCGRRDGDPVRQRGPYRNGDRVSSCPTSRRVSAESW